MTMVSQIVQDHICEQFTVTIQCTKCGQKGSEIWEENTQINGRCPEPFQLIKRSEEFYERLAKKAPYPIEVACHRCGTVLPDTQRKVGMG
jgi:hypothetical protein